MCCLITCTCLHRNILCGDYGSGANHCAWALLLQFPLHISMHSQGYLLAYEHPIQHKINWFHSRRLEMVGNITPPPLILGNGVWRCACAILNQQENTQEKRRHFLFVCLTKLKVPQQAGWAFEFKKLASESALVELERWECVRGEGLGLLLLALLLLSMAGKERRAWVSWAVWQRRGEDPSVKSSFCFPATSCCSICLFWGADLPLCAAEFQVLCGIMTETEIFPPVVNGPPLPETIPRNLIQGLPPLHRLISVNKTGGNWEDVMSHFSLMTIFVLKPCVSKEKWCFYFRMESFFWEIPRLLEPSLFVWPEAR